MADRLTWEEFSEVAVNAPALPGITPDVGLSRQYPLGADFAHIVGYVGPVSPYDLEKLSFSLHYIIDRNCYKPFFLLGTSSPMKE